MDDPPPPPPPPGWSGAGTRWSHDQRIQHNGVRSATNPDDDTASVVLIDLTSPEPAPTPKTAAEEPTPPPAPAKKPNRTDAARRVRLEQLAHRRQTVEAAEPGTSRKSAALQCRPTSESRTSMETRRSASVSRDREAGRRLPVFTVARKSVEGKQGSDAGSARVRNVLNRYLTDMKKDQVYMVRNVLAAARMDMNRKLVFGGDRPGVLYDEVSPFAEMKSIALHVTPATNAKRDDLRKFTVVHYTKAHASRQTHLYVKPKLAESPKDLPPIPNYAAYTTLRNNVWAENDEVMRYHPYFGDNGEDREAELHEDEIFIDQTKTNKEMGRRAEYSAMYNNFIHDFLADVDLSMAAITQYLIVKDLAEMYGIADKTAAVAAEARRKSCLPPEFDESDRKLDPLRNSIPRSPVAELEACEAVCKVFKDATKISIWEVVKLASQIVKESISPGRLTATQPHESAWKKSGEAVSKATGGNPWPYSLDTYAHLSCMLCYLHQCPFHFASRNEHRLNIEKGPGSKDASAPNVNHLAGVMPEWTIPSAGANKNPWAEDELCSSDCQIKNRTPNKTVWSTAQKSLLETSIAVLGNNPRCSCLCAAIINKTCAEIYFRIQSLSKTITETTNEVQLRSLEGVISKPAAAVKRRKVPYPFLPGYPADCDKAHLHDMRTHFKPCNHKGACTDSCTCVQDHITCEKICMCPASCPRRWKGCACRGEGKVCSSESKCACIKAKRECDPDLCGICGAREALDPANRYDEKTLKRACQNVFLQRDKPRRTLLGRSAIAGMGLFAGEDVKSGEFLGEYKGEVISEEEANRRGKIYDARGVSFLFNLNLSQVIDAYRAGNKFRFVNHSKKVPNCYAKVLFVGLTHRIGMYAKRDLTAGEELYFDYGYNTKHKVKFVQYEPPSLNASEDPPDPPKRAAKNRPADLELRGSRALVAAPDSYSPDSDDALSDELTSCDEESEEEDGRKKRGRVSLRSSKRAKRRRT